MYGGWQILRSFGRICGSRELCKVLRLLPVGMWIMCTTLTVVQGAHMPALPHILRCANLFLSVVALIFTYRPLLGKWINYYLETYRDSSTRQLCYVIMQQPSSRAIPTSKMFVDCRENEHFAWIEILRKCYAVFLGYEQRMHCKIHQDVYSTGLLNCV
jgi:hypothetical protein